ncbi:RNA polymerase sigma factor [Novosphingobium rosa]|uniref:RNA polymerase sigma factor n=1 Tax=Novosphingobium rosa TaxID=76978 RepID=UPI00082F51B6|nr:RNA polymerase sigma factor [Novosphingobium rosa]
MSVIRPIDRWFIEEVLPCEGRLLAAAQRLCRDPEDARDLVQDVLARMLTIEGWSAIAAPQAYMLRIMRNMAIERMRRARIVDFRQLSEVDQIDLADDAPDQQRIAEDREALAHFQHALGALPERCREVFVRRRLEDQPPRAIAEALDVSLSTLEKRLARAIHLLTCAMAPWRQQHHGEPPLQDAPGRDSAAGG